MADNVVNLFPTKDIPAMLRKLADSLEAGEEGSPETMFAITHNADEEIRFYGWGDDLSKAELTGLLTMAQRTWLDWFV